MIANSKHSSTIGSSAPTPAFNDIATEFHVSVEVSYLALSLFLVGFASGPLIWAPGSELLGRRPVFLCTVTIYTLFQLGPALATNIETLLVTRLFAGIFAAAPLTNCGGELPTLSAVIHPLKEYYRCYR